MFYKPEVIGTVVVPLVSLVTRDDKIFVPTTILSKVPPIVTTTISYCGL